MYFKNKIKFLKHRIEILAACRGAGAKEVKRTAVVCHQNFQEISGIDKTNTKKLQEIPVIDRTNTKKLQKLPGIDKTNAKKLQEIP